MPLRQGDIHIARLTDGFAVVQRFQHGEQPAVFLQQPRQRIKEPRPPVTAQLGPFGLCLARRGNRGVDLCLAGLRQRCQHIAIGGVAAFEIIPRLGERAVDEMPETAALIDQPRQCVSGIFRCRPIVHGFIDFGHAHGFTLFKILKSDIGFTRLS